MTKNEAVNTFTEGMIMDLNPLTTPNNVLTSCLNGTLITYNGNEYVLLNDMGNGRIETAYLPSGYVPVGIKESGGIIYVASYNPLTGKGQIGSFPSPERNISSEELNDSDAIIDFSSFDENLVQRVKLFGEGLVIRAGDKFSILMIPDGSWDLKNLLSNYLNVSGGAVKSFKNKAITLQVAVLDKNNNLFDITDTLKRFNLTTNEEIEDSYLLSSDVLFNTEYFTLKDDSSGSESLDEYRKNKAHNVFKSKLIGNLCIIATLNTVSFFDLSIGGQKINDVVSLYIESGYLYNCPDGKYRGDKKYGLSSDYNPNSTIVGYELVLSNSSGEILRLTIDFNTNGEFDSLELSDTIRSCVQYDETENLYKSKQLDIISPSVNTGIIYYTATPISIVGPLLGLTRSGQINLDKLGTGETSISVWRYYKNLDYTLLTWGLESYPRYNEVLSNFRFEFYDVYDGSLKYTYNIENKRSYNGTFNEVLHLPDAGENENRLFLVKVLYKSSIDGECILDYRWLFNTRLYNDAYSKYTADEQGLDFGSEKTDAYLEKEFRKIDYDYSFNPNTSRSKVTQEPSEIIENTTDVVVYEAKTSIDYRFVPLLGITLKNKDFYPFFKEITFDEKYTINKDDTINSLTTENISIVGNTYDKLIDINNFKELFELDDTKWREDNYAITIKEPARLLYKPEPKTVQVDTVFTPIMNSMEQYFGSMTDDFPNNTAIFMAGVHDLGDKYHEDNAQARLAPNVSTIDMTSNGIMNVYHKLATLLADSNDDGHHKYGIGMDRAMNYEQIQNLIKDAYDQQIIIITFSTYGFNRSSWGNGGGDDWYADSRLLESTYFLGAFWRDINGIPVLIGGYTTEANTGIAKKLYNTLSVYYKRNSEYAGESADIQGLDNTYGYNEDFSINANLYLDSKLTNIDSGYDEYIERVKSVIAAVYTEDKLSSTHVANPTILEKQASFEVLKEKDEQFTISLQMKIQGLSALYTSLSSNNIKVAFGEYKDGLFVLTYLPDSTESINLTKTYLLKNGKISLASSVFDKVFQEKGGNFYIRNIGNYKTKYGRYIKEYADGCSMEIHFNNLPAIDVGQLGQLSNLSKW